MESPLERYFIAVGVYGDVADRLKAVSASDAARLFSDSNRAEFLSFFTSLGSDIASVGTQLGVIRGGTVTEKHAELVVIKTTANGVTAFPIQIVRDLDGIWRIEHL